MLYMNDLWVAFHMYFIFLAGPTYNMNWVGLYNHSNNPFDYNIMIDL